MARVTFANGKSVNFNGTPTPDDIDHVAQQLGIQPGTGAEGAGQMGSVSTASQSGYGGYQPPPTPTGGGQPSGPSGNQFGTPFSVTGQENPLQAGAKYLGNLVPSTANDFGPILTNPGGVIQGASSLLHGAASELGRALGTGANVGKPTTPQEQMFDSLIGQYKENYFTSPENAEKKIVEDPAGFISDAATLFLGGEGAIKGADALAGTTAKDLTSSAAGTKALSSVQNSLPFPIEQTIKSGAIPRGAVYADDAGTLTPEFAQGRIDDIAQKLENFQQGLGSAFRDNVDVNKSTMDGLVQKGKDTLLNETTGQFQGLVNQAVSKGAGIVTSPLGKVAPYVKNAAVSALSQLTGLEPGSIKDVLTNPALFSKANMDATTRSALADELSSAIDKKASDLSETGQQYGIFRSQTDPVNVSQKGYIDLLKNRGIDATFDPKEGWDIGMGKESTSLSSADVNALKEYLNQYASDETHTGNSFLNARQAANLKLAKFDKLTAAGRTTNLQKIGTDFYNYLNTVGRPQIPGLEAADAQTSPLIQDLGQIKKDFIDRGTGDLKDTAASKLANAGNKPGLLSRVEKLIPGITEKLQHLKTMEDIAAATGNKVGAYGRAIAGGLGLSSIPGIGPAVGTPAGLALWAVSNPGISVPALRAAGYSEQALDAINQMGAEMVPLLQSANVNNQTQRQGLINPQALNPQL